MMRKVWIILVLSVCLLCSCAGQRRATRNDEPRMPDRSALTLDGAIYTAMVHLKESIAPDSKVAILSILSEFPRLSEHVIEELTAYMVNESSLVIVDRQNLESLDKEIHFQMSGEVADEDAQAIGKKLGAEIIITGKITLLVDVTYRLYLRAIEVETARVVAVQNASFEEDRIVLALTGKSATSDPNPSPRQEQPVPSQTAPSTSGSKTDTESLARDTRANAEQSAAKPVPRPADAWKNKWLYWGGRVGYSSFTYSLFDTRGNPSVSGGDFDWNLDYLEYVGYVSFQLAKNLALQMEAIYMPELVVVDYGDYCKNYASKSLMIPALLKLTFRPGIFLLQGYGGAYYSLPLDKVSVAAGSHSRQFELLPSAGWLAGGSIGIWIGLGVLYFDMRVGDSFGYTKMSDNNTSEDIYKRSFTSYSIGLEFGLFNKK